MGCGPSVCKRLVSLHSLQQSQCFSSEHHAKAHPRVHVPLTKPPVKRLVTKGEGEKKAGFVTSTTHRAILKRIEGATAGCRSTSFTDTSTTTLLKRKGLQGMEGVLLSPTSAYTSGCPIPLPIQGKQISNRPKPLIVLPRAVFASGKRSRPKEVLEGTRTPQPELGLSRPAKRGCRTPGAFPELSDGHTENTMTCECADSSLAPDVRTTPEVGMSPVWCSQVYCPHVCLSPSSHLWGDLVNDSSADRYPPRSSGLWPAGLVLSYGYSWWSPRCVLFSPASPLISR